ncbi:MAG TPA: 50S ribosomal protein L29 [Candidatus Woesebacteria bacterium]|nr:50S ribosomal protein L29 [Candidatus Woesebacteria bacterium]
MKKQQLSAIRAMSEAQLQAELEKIQYELLKQKLAFKANKLENPAKLKILAKEVAIIKTVMTELKTVSATQGSIVSEDLKQSSKK